MQEMYPDLVKVMGPAIDDGFYFDFDLEQKISSDDFKKIEQRMQEIINSHLAIKKIDSTVAEARKLFGKNPYKSAFIDDIEANHQEVSFYEMGDASTKHHDLDLCAGPHIEKMNLGDYEIEKLKDAKYQLIYV
jgi:threonyl-tRNA synthetase